MPWLRRRRRRTGGWRRRWARRACRRSRWRRCCCARACRWRRSWPRARPCCPPASRSSCASPSTPSCTTRRARRPRRALSPAHGPRRAGHRDEPARAGAGALPQHLPAPVPCRDTRRACCERGAAGGALLALRRSAGVPRWSILRRARACAPAPSTHHLAAARASAQRSLLHSYRARLRRPRCPVGAQLAGGSARGGCTHRAWG